MSTKSIALVVEGVGRQTPASGSSKGIAWYWSNNSSLNGTVTDSYEWIGGPGAQAGLVDAPDTVGTQVNPFEVTISGASFSFKLHKDALASELWMTRPAAQYGFLGQALTDSATTLQIPSRANTVNGDLDGTVIWVGDEAILLGTYDGATGNFQSCTRGYYSTIAQTLPKGMSVYRRNPRREDRRAILLEYDHDTSTTTQKWQGFVTDFDANSPVITVQAVELMAMLKNGVINRGDPKIPQISAEPTAYGVTRGFCLMEDGEQGERRVNKQSLNTAHWVAVNFSAGLYFAKFDTSTGDQALFADVDGGYLGGSRPQLGSEHDDEDESGFEVFAVHRVKDAANSGAENIRSSTRDLSYPFHPIEISMAFLTSGYDDGVGASNGLYDVLGYQWGLGAPSSWFGTTAISDVISATEGNRVDQMVLGWEGKPVDAWPVIQNLCRMGGFFVGTDEQGRVIFAQLRMATVVDSCDDNSVSPIPYVLQWTPSEGEGIDQLRGTIGELPFKDGQPFQVNVQGDTALLNPPNSLRAGVFSDTRSQQLDLPYRYPIEDESELGNLISITAFRGQGAPVLTIRVNGGSHAIGDILEVGDPGLRDEWFRDLEGNAISPDGSARWYGLVIGRQLNLRDSSETLSLLMTNYHVNDFARYRAPSGEISSAPTGSTYDLNTQQFTGTKPGSQFNVGDFVEVWTPDGTRRSGTESSPDIREVTSVSSTSITLASDFTTSGQANDIIRLAHLCTTTGYPGEGHDGVAIEGVTIDCALAYVYMADENETLGPQDLDGHIYGGRL